MRRFAGRRVGRWLLGLLLLTLLVSGLRLAPWQEIGESLQRLSLGQVAALIALNLVITLLFSGRWWLILRTQGQRVPYLSLAAYRLAGFAVSYFTPGTQFGGEPLQVYLLHRRRGVPAEVAVASVTLDKLFELAANFAFLGMGLAVLAGGGFSGTASPVALVSGVSVPLILPLLYLGWLWRCESTRQAPFYRLLRNHLTTLRPAWLKRLAGLLVAAEGQIQRLVRQQPRLILLLLFGSGLLWLLVVAEYALMLAFLQAPLSLTQTIGALTAARLAFLTPLPAGVGALETGQVLALQALGLPASLGLAVSLLIRARDVILGLAGLVLGAWLAPTDFPSLQSTGSSAAVLSNE